MFVIIALLALFAFLTWRNLETGVLLLCALLPSYLIRFSIGGVPTTFLEAMTFIVVGIWSIKTNWKTEIQVFKKNPLMIAIDLLLLAATIGIFISPDKQAAIGVWKAFYIEPVLVFFVILRLFAKSSSQQNRIKRTQEKIFQAFGASALLISLFGLIQYVFLIGIPAPWDLERRITSLFEYPNALALFLEPIIVISWFMIPTYVKTKPKEFWFWLFVSILSTINVFLAQSEAGIAALIVTAVCILLFSKTTRRQTLASIMIISALVFTIPTSREYLIKKLIFQDTSEQVRLSQWKETGVLLKDHPIMGVGLSGYPIALKPYHHDVPYEIFQYPHNIFLNIWVELGILGLAAFSLLAFQLFFRPFRPVSIFFFLFLEIFLHSLVDVPYFKNDLAMMTWIFIACAIALRTNKPYVTL